MRVFLARHGETELNARRVLQPPATPLSERGLDQARRLAARLAGEGIARIVSSDLERALMTADEVQRTTGAPLELEPLLQERNFGDLRGRAYAELGFDPFARDYHPPAGESWEEFEARADLAWRRVQEIAARSGGPLAVVSHGLVCRAFALHHLAINPEARGEEIASWGNTSLTIAEGPPPWRVHALNCTAHLRGEGVDPHGAATRGVA
ncbi:MAG TPA: histidine phosphatase family protein [Myxococcota bacterium]|nr:histidine phosphatase family protein [Myxococcota bacterium]